jgi:integrase
MEGKTMPAKERTRTQYPGVFYIEGISPSTGKPDRIYYIKYYRGGKRIEEKAGYQSKDDMTPARANNIRASRIAGNELPNTERRKAEREAKEAENKRWTIDKLWQEYKTQKPVFKGKKQDENRYKNHLEAAFGDKEPKDILPLDVDRVRLAMLNKKKLSPQTVKLTLSLLRRICNFGYRKRLSGPLPFSIEIPKVNNLKTEDLTTEQLTALLNAIEADTHPQAGNMMLLALYTGMRRGEMLRLKWEYIDFKKGFITLADPKGGKDQPIPMNDAARQLLKSIDETGEYVFPGRKGKQRVEIHRAVKEIKTAAGLPNGFRPLHGLRHVYASMLASSGQVDLYTLQRLLTHKDPKMTMRYAHLRDEALKRGADMAEQLINDIRKNMESKTKGLKVV